MLALLLKLFARSSPPTSAPLEAEKNPLKRKVDVRTKASPSLHSQAGERTRSSTKMETEQPNRVKLSARDLLATLSGRRISITEIKFSGDSYKDGGTYADVAVATLVRTSDSGEERRTVAVKKLRFVLNGDMTGEKFLRCVINAEVTE
ncbi:hypothetical protein FRC04_009072 [Tulasnella sp. 424]|nr:hypothetical protein FRC04_009072 [Tulasnella sp. 424]